MRILAVIFGLSLSCPTVIAATTTTSSLEWGNMFMGLFGGLALFLFGMEQMGEGLKAAAGEQMKEILAKLTTNRFTAALTGALVTAVIQSSSVTTVLVVGFISAGLMTMTQSVGVIMGANLGTTITAQIVAFKITHLALLLIAVGFFLLFLAKRDQMAHYGAMLMGLGLVFFGMDVMGDAMRPLRSYSPFLEFMETMERPLIGVLVGAAFTALVQSSSATTAIVIVMASQGFMALEAGIAVALGANIGTCITALLAAIGKPRDAVRASVVHVNFNVLGALIWLPLIPELADWARHVSPVSEELSGVARLAADTPRQVANANTLFNLANTLLFLPFAGVLAWLAMKLVPDKADIEERVLIRPRFLDAELLSTPALALERVRLELGRLGNIINGMLEEAAKVTPSMPQQRIEPFRQAKAKADLLHQYVLDYLAEIRQIEISQEDSVHLQGLMTVALHLESLSGVIADEYVDLVESTRESEIEIQPLFHLVHVALEKAIASIEDDDEKAAQAVLSSKADIEREVDRLAKIQASRHVAATKEGLTRLRAEMRVIDSLRRIYSLTKRIARARLPSRVVADVD